MGCDWETDKNFRTHMQPNPYKKVSQSKIANNGKTRFLNMKNTVNKLQQF